MTHAGNISGYTNPFANIGRAMMAFAALVVGVVIFAVSATFLLFAVLAIVVVALGAGLFFWARARLTGRPFGPREHLAAAMKDLERQQAEFAAQFEGPSHAGGAFDEGVTLDARRTPNGWSVDR